MICSQIDVKFYDDFELTNFNTLKIKSVAKKFFLPDNYGEMISILKKFESQKPIVIGNGSNILFSSKGVKNPIIYTGRIKSAFCLGDKIEVEAG